MEKGEAEMKNDLAKTLSALMIVAVLLGFAAVFRVHALVPLTPVVFVDPQSSIFSNAPVGFTFLVNVTVANVTNLAGIQFSLRWNSSLLYCNRMTDVFFHDPLITKPSDITSNIWDLSSSINNTAGTALYAFTWNSVKQAEAGGYAPANITTTGDAYGIPGYPWPEGKHGVATFNFTVLQTPNFTVPVLSCVLNTSSVKLGDINAQPISHMDIGGLYQNNYALTVSSTLVSCSPNPISVSSPAICSARVSGKSPTGNIIWTTSSSTGSFSSSIGTLSSGSCSTNYVDNLTGYVTITASYSGDAYNAPSSSSAVLTVFVNVSTGANVTIYPTNNLELTFANVTAAGYAVANATSTVNAPALNNTVGLYYSINVTARFSGNVTVSLAFDGSNMTDAQKSSLQMVQYTPIPGDINGDGTVDIYDAILLSAAFNSMPGSKNWNPYADVNGDGIVDIYDAIILSAYFGQNANWVNITLHVNTTSNIIYGNTSHFSFIAIH
jgi:hypothetical protein